MFLILIVGLALAGGVAGEHYHHKHKDQQKQQQVAPKPVKV